MALEGGPVRDVVGGTAVAAAWVRDRLAELFHRVVARVLGLLDRKSVV